MVIMFGYIIHDNEIIGLYIQYASSEACAARPLSFGGHDDNTSIETDPADGIEVRS